MRLFYVFTDNEEFVNAINEFYGEEDWVPVSMLALEMELDGPFSGRIKVYALSDEYELWEQAYANADEPVEYYDPKEDAAYEAVKEELEKLIPQQYPYVTKSVIRRIYWDLIKNTTKEELKNLEIWEDDVVLYFEMKYEDYKYRIIFNTDSKPIYAEKIKGSEEFEDESILYNINTYKSSVNRELFEEAIKILEEACIKR